MQVIEKISIPVTATHARIVLAVFCRLSKVTDENVCNVCVNGVRSRFEYCEEAIRE